MTRLSAEVTALEAELRALLEDLCPALLDVCGTGPVTAALLQRRAETNRETRKAALCVLKRHLSDVIYRALHANAWPLDQPDRHTT